MQPLLFAQGVADSGTDALLLAIPGGGDFVATPVRIREVGELNGPDIYRTTTVTREMNTIRGAVRQGDSGGPIIDLDGKALGVAFWSVSMTPSTCFGLTGQGGRSTVGEGRQHCAGGALPWEAMLARHARWVRRLPSWGPTQATQTRVRAVIFSEFGVRPEVRGGPRSGAGSRRRGDRGGRLAALRRLTPTVAGP